MSFFECCVCKEDKIILLECNVGFTCSHIDKLCIECSTKLQYCPLCRNTDKIYSHDMYLALVNTNCLYLQDVPENMKTMDVCLKAVSNGGLALEYVPENMKTMDVCLKAVSNGGLALEYVPENMKTIDV